MKIRGATKRRKFLAAANIATIVALLSCSWFLVHEQITKFAERKTSLTMERVVSHDMEFPGLMVCAQNGYKTGALADMGFPEDTLRTRSRPTEDNFDFDPENVWEEGTYSMDELAIGWLVLQDEKGTVSKWTDPSMAGVEDINTMSKGKCLLWTTKIKATSFYPVVALYIKTPPNDTIFIHVHEQYDTPVMDALNFAWPNEGTKITLKDEHLSIYNLKLETTEDINSPDAPCISDLDYSYSKCLTAEMTRLYMSEEPYKLITYMGTHCLNATSVPCSIPQIKDITYSWVQDSLKKCPSFWDYNCELIVLWHAKQAAYSKCLRPCQTSQYRLSLVEEERMSKEFLAQKVANIQLSLRFSTNTVMKYKEVQVFDFADIFGSVGGSLGMFLGISFLEAAQYLLRKVVF